MEAVWKINGIVNGIVWGPWMLTLLVGTGVWLTLILGFPQVRYFGLMIREVIGRIREKSTEEGSISSFAAMAQPLPPRSVPETSPASPPPSRRAVRGRFSGCG